MLILFQRNNIHDEASIKLILAEEFQQDMNYTRQSMRMRLQELYDQFEIKKHNGKRKRAAATQFVDYGFAIKQEQAMDGETEILKPGFRIVAQPV